jgi:outer membrane biosynthesis protein TonB
VIRRAGGARLGTPIVISAVAHAGAIALLFAVRPTPAPARPPVYKVNIIAAPPGPRAIGAVTPTPPAETPPDAKPPARAEVQRAAPVLPPKTEPPARRRTAPPPSTPVPIPPRTTRTNQPPAQAGGGPTGGRGTDVATVRTEGIAFPFPGYLNNIVRQIALRFKPDERRSALRAELSFLIHRDGTISNVRFITRSGAYDFDLEAQGSIEAAASAKSFGPLPQGFTDDVLPVIFSFDPTLLR